MIVLIPLSNGGAAIIDEKDVPKVTGRIWRKQGDGRRISAVVSGSGSKGLVLIHRLIMKPGDDEVVDHRSRNVLDNTRLNLRVCTPSQNACNRKIHRNNRIGLKGVYSDPIRGTPRFRAQISVSGKQMHLGSFPTPELAHEAYCNAAKRLHGEFARLN